MCGILGVVARSPVNQLLYDGLLLLQHRGQDAAGIVTSRGATRSTCTRGRGMVRDVFRTRNMRSLPGNIGHRPLPLSDRRLGVVGRRGAAVLRQFAVRHRARPQRQPDQLRAAEGRDVPHGPAPRQHQLRFRGAAQRAGARAAEGVGQATRSIRRRSSRRSPACTGACRGAYAVVAMIAGLRRCSRSATRSASGRSSSAATRPTRGTEYMVASESVALDALGFQRGARRRARARRSSSTRTATSTASSARRTPALNPCIFEYVYLARPDSVIDGISVYETRLQHGREPGATRSAASTATCDIDVVIPIPDSSRPSALQLADAAGPAVPRGLHQEPLHRPHLHHAGAGDAQEVGAPEAERRSAMEFKGKNVLLVDDSIVRGTTSREIVQMAREAGARKVFFASAAPPVRFPNVYGIDMPTRDELIAARPQRGRGRARDRRRRADLPGPRRAEATRAQRQPEADELRGLVLRRRLHHRRHHQPTTCARSRSSRDAKRDSGDDESAAARPEPGRLIY